MTDLRAAAEERLRTLDIPLTVGVMEALTLAEQHWWLGIEFALRKSGGLYIWPKECVPYLSVETRDYVALYKPELTILAKAKALPETTIKWQPPVASTAPAPPVPCVYCRRAPCIGSDHPAFPTLHFADPTEVARRNEEATKEMLKMLPYGQPY